MFAELSLVIFLINWGTASTTNYYHNNGPSAFHPSDTQHYGVKAYPDGNRDAGYDSGYAPAQEHHHQAQETATPVELPPLNGVSFVQPTGFEFDQKVTHFGQEGLKTQAAHGQRVYAAPAEHGGYVEQQRDGYGGSERQHDRYAPGDHYHGGESDGYAPSSSNRYETMIEVPEWELLLPEASGTHYSYGSEEAPKSYNTERSFAYEKIYPERSYSHNHAVSYNKDYGDHKPSGYGSASSYGPSSSSHGDSSSYGPSYDEHYGPSSSAQEPSYGPSYSGGRPYDGQSSESQGEPRVRSYVYRDPYDKSTTKVVEMRRGSPEPSAGTKGGETSNMGRHVQDIMRQARGSYY
ncbi:RNA-binding motif protein, X chromosome-like [Ornithodoros turicata]|uniref:RNA-binding motif protein, X chromosome-like n=1 Tax=Ornithodoros turicata TaxID=34597 RepID=UPI0031394A53